jgi:predicted transcriptional regulator
MKTAISIPDDVFERAERLAKLVGKSRSQLYCDAVRESFIRSEW